MTSNEDSMLEEDIAWYLQRYRSDPKFLTKLSNRRDAYSEFKKHPDELERINRFNQTRMNILYGKIYDNADTLYRGLSSDELKNMITHRTFGGGKSTYPWINVTPDKRTAIKFALQDNYGVVIQFPKKQVDPQDIKHPGYLISGKIESETIDEPKNAKLFDEQEHRIKKNKICIEDLDMIIIFLDIPLEDQDQKRHEFGKLGNVKFASSKEFKRSLGLF